MIGHALDQASYMAHGYCLLWKPWLVALHAGSDFLIFAAYFAIPIALWIFLAKRPNIELRGMARMFAAFILWCGLTHIINLVTLWYPVYEFQGAVKAITAAISVTTAIAIFPLIPKAMAIPSPAELRLANGRLAAEIDAHRQTLKELAASHDQLEARVRDRTQELEDVSKRFQALFDYAPVAMLMTDQNGRIKQANATAATMLGFSAQELAEKGVEELLPETVRDAHRGLRTAYVSKPVARPMGAGRELFALCNDGSEIAVEIGLNPMEVAGEPYVVASIIDITERRQREEQVKLLMREVNHRSKNMLGVVQSIARHTAATDPKDFADRFSARVRALSASQDLLISSDWRGAEINDLVRAQLAHFTDLIGSRIILKGPSVRLSAAAAQTIGMALHELATNAGKYGALSNAAGTINIEWTVQRTRSRFAIAWAERGGPPVSPPARRGFGMTVIEPMAKMGLAGDVHLEFASSGLTWRLDCPIDRALDKDSIITGGREARVS